MATELGSDFWVTWSQVLLGWAHPWMTAQRRGELHGRGRPARQPAEIMPYANFLLGSRLCEHGDVADGLARLATGVALGHGNGRGAVGTVAAIGAGPAGCTSRATSTVLRRHGPTRRQRATAMGADLLVRRATRDDVESRASPQRCLRRTPSATLPRKPNGAIKSAKTRAIDPEDSACTARPSDKTTPNTPRRTIASSNWLLSQSSTRTSPKPPIAGPASHPSPCRPGFRAADAIPMRLRGQIIGALNLFRTETGSLSDDDVVVAQALADIATIAILQNRNTVEQPRRSTPSSTTALSSRIVIEQAKGMIAERQRHPRRRGLRPAPAPRPQPQPAPRRRRPRHR